MGEEDKSSKEDKGSYLLVMKLDREREIPVGKMGAESFPGGYYCYVGSAMNSMEKRICRHLSKEKRKRWHIDWFLDHASVVDVKRIHSNKKEECSICREVDGLSDGTPVKGFGSTDCKACQAHLHFFEEDPSDELEEMITKWKASSGTTRE